MPWCGCERVGHRQAEGLGLYQHHHSGSQLRSIFARSVNSLHSFALIVIASQMQPTPTPSLAGISTLQFTLPATWTEGRGHGASLNNLSYWLSEAPAKLAGLWHAKGSLEPVRIRFRISVASTTPLCPHALSPYLFCCTSV